MTTDKDGKGRLVGLRTPTGAMLRPRQMICSLEMHESDGGLRQCSEDLVQKITESTSDDEMMFTRYEK